MKLYKGLGRKLVLIEWRDACAPTTMRWVHFTDLAEQATEYTCLSAGWIVGETRTHLTLAPHRGHVEEPLDEQYAGFFHIPKPMIQRIMPLSAPKGAHRR